MDDQIHLKVEDQSMNRYERLSKIIRENIVCSHLKLTNQTAEHHRPPELETHFDLIVASKDFEKMSRVARQQLIMSLLKDEFSSGLHALSIQAYTPQEFATSNAFEPPECGGKNH